MSAYYDAVLADSPDVYYRLSQTGSGAGALLDASGNGHHATPNGTIVTAASLLAMDTADVAAAFDWTTLFYSATTGYTLSQQPMTVEFWVKPLSLTSNGGAAGHICACGPTGGWGIKILDTSGIWRMTTNAVKDYDFTATAVIGVIQHMVFILTAAHDVDLYVNGAFSQTVLHSVAMSATTAGLTIGMRSGAGPGEPQAVIDELAIYTSALSAGRIAAHYTAATVGSTILSRLAATQAVTRASDW